MRLLYTLLVCWAIVARVSAQYTSCTGRDIYATGGIASVTATTTDACWAACQTTPGCAVAVLESDENICYLKNEVAWDSGGNPGQYDILLFPSACSTTCPTGGQSVEDLCPSFVPSTLGPTTTTTTTPHEVIEGYFGGTWQTQGSCASSCCCIEGCISITYFSDGSVQVQAPVAGQCSSLSSIDATITYGAFLSVTDSGFTFQFTQDQDQVMYVQTEGAGQCTRTAKQTTTVPQQCSGSSASARNVSPDALQVAFVAGMVAVVARIAMF